MIELARMWLRHQPDSRFGIWFRERVGTLKGRIRRITIVAMARKLLITLWRYLETGVVPPGEVLESLNPGASLNTIKRNISNPRLGVIVWGVA
jgi:hypothetical protein